MTDDKVLIRTPHGFEWVQAVVQYAGDGSNPEEVADFVGVEDHQWDRTFQREWCSDRARVFPGQFVLKHLDNTVTVHDTDPRINPTWTTSPLGMWGTGKPARKATYNLGDGWTLAGPWTDVPQ